MVKSVELKVRVAFRVGKLLLPDGSYAARKPLDFSTPRLLNFLTRFQVVLISR